ncbi:MAG: nucleotidyl transferase AbiEii/AbiGii toxin family protein [Thermovirga sp.]|nr:nucleotidyl transferase AbiEii/AbiGii toxin family protein [Thermovirga sp.]
MRPLRLRIRAASEQQGIPQQVIEKDYVLSYILVGISSHSRLKGTLVFKGGTALKKLFFGEYRFSEDLDFSGVNSPKGEKLEGSLREAMKETHRLLSLHGPFAIQLERYLERDPHPHGQEAFIVRVQFPWHREPLCRIKLEITHDEPVLLKPEKRQLIHGYGEDLSCEVCCYRLEEIIAEKLRTLLQTHQKIVLRGWNRPRARDYYDLWRILNKFGAGLNRKEIGFLLERKNAHRGVSYQSINDFFSEELISEAYRHWNSSLGPFVAELPECQKVLEELRALLHGLL